MSSPPDIHSDLLYARIDLYHRCMRQVAKYQHNNVVLDFHAVRFDPNHVRKERELAKILVAHIAPYALRESKLQQLKHPVNNVVQEAMSLFVKRDSSGEAGEVLLYFLTEIFLGAPQLVAKMSLKTSGGLEYNGSDGIHFRYNGPDEPLDVYLGESKIWDDAAEAIDDALKSINTVRDKGLHREITLATENFKWLDAKIQNAILELLDPDSPKHSCRINYVALVGFEMPPHGNLKRTQTEDMFLQTYKKRAKKLQDLTAEKLDSQPGRTDDIVRIFYVPFTGAEEFRAYFRSYLTTGNFK